MQSTQMYRAGKRRYTLMIRIEGGPDSGTDFTVNVPATIGRRQGLRHPAARSEGITHACA